MNNSTDLLTDEETVDLEISVNFYCEPPTVIIFR